MAGNAVYAQGNGTYSSPNARLAANNGVDLSLTNNSYSYSNELEANVMINVKAKGFVSIFSISQQGNTIEEAEALMRRRISAFKLLLQQSGVDSGSVFTDPVALLPTYETEVTEKKFSKTFNEVPSGFEIKKNVHITFTQHGQINNLITVAGRAEIYDLVKVDYEVEDMDKILEQLRQEALHILMSKKEVMERTGITTRFVQVGERYGSAYPFERYAQYLAYKTGAGLAAVSYKKGQQVVYNYAEKNKTVYYEKVSNKQFDKVINPVVGEPEVQVYLSLKGRYERYDPVQEAADKKYAASLRELDQKDKELDYLIKKKRLEGMEETPKKGGR